MSPYLVFRNVRTENKKIKNWVTHTFGENIIGTTKIRNNYGAIKSFFIALCKVIALPTIAIAIVVALSRS